jgi:alkanesulfonate monooxygenase SsuD/methylene tetrahydromethanopterin reductase-like flavin-dependent oxidoreductase (luciferase family)
MARPGVSVSRGSATARYEPQAPDERLERWNEEFDYRPHGRGASGRRTVQITGQGAEGYTTRNGTRPSAAQRHQRLKPYERAGFRPDRMAMWAVLLGVMLMLAAIASAHV